MEILISFSVSLLAYSCSRALIQSMISVSNMPGWNCEGPDVLSYLQANKLPCHSFVTQKFLSSSPPGTTWRGPGDTYTDGAGAAGVDPELRESDTLTCFNGQEACLLLCPGERHSLRLPRWSATCTSLRRVWNNNGSWVSAGKACRERHPTIAIPLCVFISTHLWK